VANPTDFKEDDLGRAWPTAPRVVITGLGSVSPLGLGCDELWDAVASGRHGIREVDRFSTEAYACHLAASLPSKAARELLEQSDRDGCDPCSVVAIAAAREAILAARVDPDRLASGRVALVLGTSAGGLRSRSRYEFAPREERALRHDLLARSEFPEQTARVASALGITGPRLTISTACTSSGHAIIHGRELLAAGLADIVLAGGVDVLVEELFAGFAAMGAMSPSPCSPFSEPEGMTLGEGAGFVVLERLADARARGVEVEKILCELTGTGTSADGYHATAPDPTGSGLARAVLSALADAGLSPDAIGYVNAHGTGTTANDAAEHRGLVRALGERALPISSTKSYFGHTLGAAAVLELIVTILAMRRGLVPPTLHFTRARGACPPDPVAEPKPRPAHYSHALSTSAAFGGANSAIIVGLERNSIKLQAAPEEPVVILGAGVLAAHGSEGFDEALRAAAPLWTEIASKETPVRFAARIPAETLAAPIRGVDARELDVVSRQLSLATLLALKNAGVRLRGPLRERAGLYAGAYRLPWDSAEAFWDSIRERGFSRASAPAFARMVMNAALGTTSRALSLRGPVSLVAGGPGSGLAALLLASAALGKRRDADLIAAAGVFDLGLGLLDEHAHRYPAQPASNAPFPVYFPDDSDADERPVWAEGAASIVLSTARFARDGDHKPLAHLAGAAIAGPGRLAEAIRAALRRASLDPSAIDAVYGSADGRRASGQREINALRDVLGLDFLTKTPLSNPAPVLGYAETLDLISFAAALEAIRTGRAHPLASGGPSFKSALDRPVQIALVITDDEASGSAAALITAPDHPSIASNSSSIQTNEPAVPNG
jgi:3-oxoacyl-[acyl-carrier-protein] synthase II